MDGIVGGIFAGIVGGFFFPIIIGLVHFLKWVTATKSRENKAALVVFVIWIIFLSPVIIAAFEVIVLGMR